MCRLKLSRLFCLLFALSVFFGSFGLSASAASDNLIDSNLSNWKQLTYTEGVTNPFTITPAGNIYRVTLAQQDLPMYFGVLLDETSLIAGHSYSLSFRLPSRAECNEAFGNSYSASVYNNHFINSEIRIGVGFVSASGEVTAPEGSELYYITKDNYTNFFGKTLKASFIASSYTGTPAIYINIVSLDGSKHTFYFSDFKLVDNDDNSEELDGIKGFLHSIRWDLVGGTCEEEDCPHSSGDNPHLSLSERMSSGFASMFQNIGDKFEEGSTLDTWFTNLVNNVSNLDGSLSNLGDRFQGFIDNLGGSFSIDIGDFKTSVSDWFDNLQKSWDDWIAGLKQKMDDGIASITAKAQEIGDKFSEFFDKFKPRVYMNFDWHRGFIRFADGSVQFNDSYDAVLISDFFTISEGNKFYIDFIPNKDLGITNFTVFIYDMQGNYLNEFYSYSSASEKIELDSGFQYRFRVTLSYGYEENIVNDYFFVYAEEGWINALLYNAKMGLRSLFVPDEAFIATWKEELELLLQERLGIIWDAGDFFIALIQTIGDLLTTTPDDIHYELPEMVIELNGQTYTLWQAQQVDFSFLEKNAFFAMLYKLYKAVLNVFLGIPLLNYAKKEMDATLHN